MFFLSLCFYFSFSFYRPIISHESESEPFSRRGLEHDLTRANKKPPPSNNRDWPSTFTFFTELEFEQKSWKDRRWSNEIVNCVRVDICAALITSSRSLLEGTYLFHGLRSTTITTDTTEVNILPYSFSDSRHSHFPPKCEQWSNRIFRYKSLQLLKSNHHSPAVPPTTNNTPN